ncbi:MAG: tetratricopeptide repeat protein [Bdellovibrionota bacterium]
MKITCSACGSKYQLDDAKIKGKTKKFGVKCPSCQKVIVVHPDGTVEPPAGAASEAPPESPPAESPAAGDPFSDINFDQIGKGGGKPAAPAAPPPAAGGDDPFNFDAAEAPSAPPAAAPPPPPEPASDPFDLSAAPPPKAAAPKQDDPFDFGNVDLSSQGSAPPAAPSAPASSDPFDFGVQESSGGGGGGGGAAAAGGGDYGNVDLGGGEDTSGLDDLDKMDKEIEKEAASGGGNVFGEGAGAGSYRLKNARGQVAGPFTVDAIREFSIQGKFTGQEEISRNDGPWLSVSVLTELPDLKTVNLDSYLSQASAAAAPEMDGSIGFSEEEMSMGTGMAKAKKRPTPKWVMPAVAGLIVLLLGGAGGWYWWAYIREIPIGELTDAKITELVQTNRTPTDSRAALSEQAYTEADAILDRYAVEEFPQAEAALLTSIQKNPTNHKALARLAWLSVEWADVLGAKERLARANALSGLAKQYDAGLPESAIAAARLTLASGKVEEAVKQAEQAAAAHPRVVDAKTLLARALIAKGDYAGADKALEEALAIEAEDQLALLTFALSKERQRLFDDAAARYEQAIASRPGNLWPKFQKARLRYVRKDYTGAQETMAEVTASPALAKVSDLNVTVRVLESAIVLALGQSKEALDILSQAERAAPGRADVTTAKGDILFKTERYAEALQEYQKSITADSKYMPAHLKLGKTKFYLGDNEQAEKSLRDALKIDPESTEASLLLGQTLVRLKKFDEAQKAFDEVVAREPNNAVAYAEMGRMLAAKDEKDAAAAMFQKAVELDPTNASVFLTMGEILRDLGRTEEALSHAQKAAELAPESVEAKVLLGRLYYVQKRYADSVAQLSGALEASPRNVSLLIDLAKARRAERDFAAARKDLEAVKEIQASNAEGRYLLGRTLFDLGDAPAAEGDLSRAVAIDDKVPEYFFWFGRVLHAQSKYRDAQLQFEKAIKLDEKYVDAHYWLGLTYAVQGSMGKAKIEFEQTVDIAPRHVDAMVELGTICQDFEKDSERALRLFNDVIRIDRRNARAPFNICRIYQDQRKPDLAAPKCEAAIKIDPTLCEAHVELGYAYAALNKTKNACGAWRKALKCTKLEDIRRQDVQDQIDTQCQ